jgi:asparagine synthase (glutamine-hydrolysing)
MDFENYLAEDILVKVDRASMLNSLEIRAPFLDYRVIEFAYGKVPTRLKATLTNKKIILKRLCEKLLPEEFDRQRKQGFSIPLAQWLKQGELREMFYDVLGKTDGMFDKKAVNDLLQGQDKGRANSQRLFALVLFELWRKEYAVTL